MFCKYCGTECTENMSFCSNCGNKLEFSIVNQEPAVNVPDQQQVVYVYANPPKAIQPGNGFAIASFVCGIISFIISPLVFGILAVIFGGMAKSKGHVGKFSTLGMIFGIIGIGLWILTSAFLTPLLQEFLINNGTMY